jgi:hypothetical protein
MSKKIMENLTKMKIIVAETMKKWMKLIRNTYTMAFKAINYAELVYKLHQKVDSLLSGLFYFLNL